MNKRNVSLVFPNEGGLSTGVYVTQEGDAQYRLQEHPLFAESAKYGDLIRCRDLGDDHLEFLEVVEASKFEVFDRITQAERLDSAEVKTILGKVMSSGGFWQRDFSGLIVVLFDPKVYDPRSELEEELAKHSIALKTDMAIRRPVARGQSDMKLEQPALMFSTWLELAAFQAVRFGQRCVKQKLSYEFRFELRLNMAADDLAVGGFELYPEDDGRVVVCDNVKEVAAELVRNERIPVWIDIAVSRYSKAFTLLGLTCAGRFTDESSELYYHPFGTGCFLVKSPVLPPGYKEGGKFKIERA